MIAKCLECQAEILFDEEPVPAEIIKCGECHVELEVLSIDPIQFIVAPEIEEDWGE